MENSTVTIEVSLTQRSIDNIRYIQLIGGKTDSEIVAIALEHFRKQLEAYRMLHLG